MERSGRVCAASQRSRRIDSPAERGPPGAKAFPPMSDLLEVKPAPGRLIGTVQVPGSKSITNRALMLAAMADGVSTLNNALFSDDTRYMSKALRALGIGVEEEPKEERFRVTGTGGRIPES